MKREFETTGVQIHEKHDGLEKPKLETTQDNNTHGRVLSTSEQQDRSMAIAQKLLASFTEAVQDIGFALVPLELRLAIARGQDITKRMTKQSRVEFKDLPLELRSKIYGYILVEKHVIVVNKLPSIKRTVPPKAPERIIIRNGNRAIAIQNGPDLVPAPGSDSALQMPPTKAMIQARKEKDAKKATNILLVSKSISGEALDVLYKTNIFQINLEADMTTSSGWYFTAFSIANRLRIKHLRLTYDFKNLSWICHPIQVLTPLPEAQAQHCKPLFEGLATLKIATAMDHDLRWLVGNLARVYGRGTFQSRLPGPLSFWTTRDAFTRVWPEWLAMNLRLVAGLTASNLMVCVDGGGRVEAQAVVDQCFAGRNRVVTLYSGVGGFDEVCRGME